MKRKAAVKKRRKVRTAAKAQKALTAVKKRKNMTAAKKTAVKNQTAVKMKARKAHRFRIAAAAE